MTMPEPQYHLVLMTFPAVRGAKEALGQLKESRALDGIRIETEALVARDEDGEIRMDEPGAAGVGAAFGAVSAAVVALLTGPIILPMVIVVGGALGGIAGHLAGKVIPEDDLRRVGERMPPGSSAWVAIVDADQAAGLVAAFRDTGARVLEVPVQTEAASAIREGLMREVTPADPPQRTPTVPRTDSINLAES